MAWAFPSDLEARDGQLHARHGGDEAVMVGQVSREQWGCPHRGVVVVSARVMIDRLINQWINDTLDRQWAPTAPPRRQPQRNLGWVMTAEDVNPLINHLATDFLRWTRKSR